MYVLGLPSIIFVNIGGVAIAVIQYISPNTNMKVGSRRYVWEKPMLLGRCNFPLFEGRQWKYWWPPKKVRYCGTV